MPEAIAKAYVQIIPTTKGIANNLTKELSASAEGAGTSAGASFGRNFVGALKKIGVTAAVGKFFKNSISQGAELEQNLGGTEAVFGNFAKNIQNLAQDAYKNMGISASEYMATANKMGSLFQGSGIEQRESLDLTSKAMQRAADVASVMGIDMEMAMESIAGAAKGNFTMMDNLGVAMNATTIEAYAMSKGMEDFKYSAATNAEKAQIAMQMFFEKTQQYEGNFQRESEETLSGSLGRMKSAWQNFLGNLSTGADLSAPLRELGTSVSTFFEDNLVPMVKNVFSGILETAKTELSEKIPGLSLVFENLETVLATLTTTVIAYKAAMAFSGIINKLKTATEGQTIAQAALNLVTSANPFVLVATAVAGLAAALVTLWKTNDGFRAAVINAWDSIKNAATSMWSAVKEILESISTKFKEITEIGGNLVVGLWNGIKDKTTWVLDKIRGFGQSILNGIKKVFGIASPSKEMAWMGKMLDQGLAQGIERNVGVVSDAMGAVTDATMRTFTPTISAVGENTPRGGAEKTVESTGTEKPIIIQLTLDGKVIGETAWNYNRQRARAMG